MKNGLEGRKLEHKKKEKKRKWRANRLNRYTKSHDIYFWNSLLKTMGSDKIPSEYLKHSLFHLENERLTFHPATNWLNQVPKRYVLISHQRVFPGRGSWKFEIERRMPAEMSNAWKGKFWIGNMNFLPIDPSRENRIFFLILWWYRYLSFMARICL